MIGQRLAPGPGLGRRFFRACLDRRTAFANARNIVVEVLEGERHLVWIEALGAASELRPFPSQNRILTICALLPRKAKRWPQNGSFFSVP